MEVELRFDKNNISPEELIDKMQDVFRRGETEMLISFAAALAAVIDERTPYNGLHTRKVVEYSHAIVDRINELYKLGESDIFFSEDHIDRIIFAATVHDIGKMVTPLGIMNKSTRLGFQLPDIKNRLELIKCHYEIDLLKNRISKEEYDNYINTIETCLDRIEIINNPHAIGEREYGWIEEMKGLKYVYESGKEIKFLTDEEVKSLMIPLGTLNDEERQIMEDHVVMTEKILNFVKFTDEYQCIVEWASNHHELLDGSGYPKGLKGDEICIESRIITIADIYDALTARDRPYKEHIASADAFNMLYQMADEGKLERRFIECLEKYIKG